MFVEFPHSNFNIDILSWFVLLVKLKRFANLLFSVYLNGVGLDDLIPVGLL